MTEMPGALLMVVVDVDPEHEEEFNRWYDKEHIPERLAMPGFRSARRYASHDRPGRYLAIYEIDGPDVVTSPEYLSQPMSDRSREVMATWRHLDRSVWIEITGPMTGHEPDGSREPGA
jgi:hypothetical protein